MDLDQENKTRVIKILMTKMGVENPQVTPQVLSIFASIPYRQLVRPIVLEMKQNDKTQGEIAARLGITIRQVQWIVSQEKD